MRDVMRAGGGRASGSRRHRGLGRRAFRPLVVAAALLAVTGCKPLDDAMVAVFGRSMRDQRSFDPYENTQAPPENAVPFAAANFPPAMGDVMLGDPDRGEFPPHFTQAELGLPGVGTAVIQGMTNPVDPSDPVQMARGEELYNRFCVVCHGPDGVGANAYIAAQHPILPAYNLSGAQVAGYSDQYLYAIIRVGRGLMPAYGPRITHFDRWRIVNYVRQLQQQAGTLQAGN